VAVGRLAITTGDTAEHVEVFDPTTGAGSVIAAAWSPQWSPDGSRIAFLGYHGVSVARPDGSERQLLAQGTDEEAPFPVPDFSDPGHGGGSGIATDLAWSPHGSKLASTLSGVESGRGYLGLYLDSIRIAASTRTDGRIVATLTHLRALQPSWQPLCVPSS
jgi:hypothetical protein